MHSISYEEANRIYEREPTVFKRQQLGNLVLFDYFYANWQIFRDYPLSRNLRGVIFDVNTRQVVSLPFHKFFNVNENESTKEEKLDFNGLMLDKQDGSMAQVTFHNNELVVASRSSLSGYVNKAVTEFLGTRPDIVEYVRRYPSYTFLFEFLDPDNRIVLSHSQKELVFLNARDKFTGNYQLYYFKGNIPCRSTSITELYEDQWERVKEGLSSAENFEGYVLYLNAHEDFYKIKTAWYVASHKLVTEQSPKGYLEAWANDSLDDLAASLTSLGHGGVLVEISSYIRRTEEMLSEKLRRLLDVAVEHESAKELAIDLNTYYVRDDVDRMLFGAVMKAWRNDYLDFGTVFNDFRTSLAGRDNKLKVIVEAIDKAVAV